MPVLGGDYLWPGYRAVSDIPAAHICAIPGMEQLPAVFLTAYFWAKDECLTFWWGLMKISVFIRLPCVAQGTDSVQIHERRIHLPCARRVCRNPSRSEGSDTVRKYSEFLLWLVLLTHQRLIAGPPAGHIQ
jgi:hypothetical protein